MIEAINRPCACDTCSWLRDIAAASRVPSMLWDSGGGCILLILSAEPEAVLQGMGDETKVPAFVAVDSECFMGGYRSLDEWNGDAEATWLGAHDGEGYPPAAEFASAAERWLTGGGR